MRLSPAPNDYPSGLRPVAAAGAGVQFAADPIHGMRVRDSLPALTMQNGTGTGLVAFTFRGWSWLGHAEHCKAGHGAVWRNVTPRNGDNFSGLGSACQGWARHRETRRQRNPRRYSGQFSGNGAAGLGVAVRATAWQQRELGAVSKRNFPRQDLLGRCKPWLGESRRGYTLPRAESGTISRGPARQVVARNGVACRGNNVTRDGNPGHFPKHQEAPASRGATVHGMTGSV